MELVTNTTCLLCKQQTTVLKFDNVKTYLDKLFDTFFDKSNIFKDEGMVANASLCLMCTPKVNICCNLRNDYEDKYNGKCLQKLLSTSGCLLCDGNLTPLTKTQDMPVSLLEKIELFMNSTSFPESYSSSALCLTCIHSLNIWHEIRSSIMKLRQNDEVDENNDADSDSTDISNLSKNVQLKSKKAKTKPSTLDKSNVEKENIIDLVDSDAEGVEKVDNRGKSATQTSLKGTGNVTSDDETDDIQSKENVSDRSRSASPSLLNNKFGKKFRHQQKAQKLSLNKNVKGNESLISDASDSEIDDLNKIVEEIVESYENEEAALKMTSLNSSKAKNSDEQNISKIDDSCDVENQSNTTQKSLNKASNISPSKSTSLRWISKRKTFMNLTSDSSDSESVKEKKRKKLKRRRPSTFPKDNIDNEETKIEDSSDEDSSQKNNRNLNRSRLSILSKGSPKPASPKHKKSDKEDREKTTKIDDSSSLSESESPELKKSDNRDREKTTKLDDSSDEEHAGKNKPKLNRSRLSILSKRSPKPESPKHKKSDKEDRDKTTKIHDSSDEKRPQKNTQKLDRSKVLTSSTGSSESESSELKKSDNRDRGKTTKLDDSSDEEHVGKSKPKLNLPRLSVLSKGSPKPVSPKHKKSDKKNRDKTTKIDDSSDEKRPQKNTQKLNQSKVLTSSTESSESESSELKKSDNRDREKTTKLDDSSDEENVGKSKPKLNRSRLSILSKGSPKPESPKHKKSDKEDREKTTTIHDSCDEELQKNTQKLNRSKPVASSTESSESESSKQKKSDNENREETTKIDDSSDEDRPQKNTQKLNHSSRSTLSKRNLNAKSPKHKRSDNRDRGKTSKIDDSSDSSNQEHGRKNSKKSKTFNKKKYNPDKQEVTKIVSSSEDDEMIMERNKRKPKLILKLKTQEHKKSKNKEQITESEDSSDTENTQNSKRKRRSTRLEAQTTIIDDSSDNESDHAPSSQKDRKNRESETRKINNSSDSESTETESTEKLKGFKISTKADNRKSDRNSESETKSDDSSDSESTSDLSNKNSSKTRTSNRTLNQKNKRRSQCLQNSSETKKSRRESSRISDSSDEFESKSSTRKRSLRKFPTPPKIVLSDSSDQENMNTSSSKLRTTINSKTNKKHDNLWLYLNKRLNKLQSVKKLHKNENINLPDARLDDKFFNQLPYVLLEKNDEALKTKTGTKKTISKEFPKVKLRLQKRTPVNTEDDRRTSRRINKSPITITLSDDESEDVMNSSFVEIETLCCPICDKISKTFSECKAHNLFHEKPEQVVINLVRENLKQLQEKYNRSTSNNIDYIASKYLNISENNVGQLQETISNGHSSGSVEVEDKELQLVEDLTFSKSHIPLPNEKSSSTSEDNSDCENVPNIVYEKKRKLSILLNNSRDKSDSSSPNPKRVRFALDHKTSIPNAQSTEDLTKTKLKRSKDDIHNLTL